MTEDDFLFYYQYPLADMYDCEGDAPFFMFPKEAEKKGSAERKKAMEALWRFYKAGLLSCLEKSLEIIRNLETEREIYWQSCPYLDVSEEAIALISNFNSLHYQSDSQNKVKAAPYNQFFYKKLSQIFTEAGVGFEKEDILSF